MTTAEKQTIYELSYIIKTGESDAQFLSVLSSHSATITDKSPLSAIQLAYPINKNQSGQFGFLKLTVPESTAIAAITHDLNSTPSVLRFLFVKVQATRRITSASLRPKEAAVRKPATPAEVRELSNEKLEQTLEEILK